MAQVQDLALGFAEPEVLWSPVLELVSLDSILSLWHVSFIMHLVVAEGAFNPTVGVIDEDIEEHCLSTEGNHSSLISFQTLIHWEVFSGYSVATSFSSVHSSNPSLSSLERRMLWGTFLKPSLHSITTSRVLPEYQSLFPLPVQFLLALQFHQQDPVKPCCSLIFFSILPTLGNGELLCPKENFLKDLPDLLPCSWGFSWEALLTNSLKS